MTEGVKSGPAVRNCICVACGSRCHFFGKREGYRYFACERCRTLQLNPLPEPEELARTYRDEYACAGHYATSYEDSMRANRPFYRWILDILDRTSRPEGKVLDFGCGYGGLCEMARARGLECVGVDPSTEEIAIARARGLDVYAGDVSALPSGTRFSAVVMLFVLEHLVGHDALLDDVRGVVEPGGLIIITIPTSPFVVLAGRALRLFSPALEMPKFNETLTPPWHTVIFSVKGIRALMLRHGMPVERVLRSPKSKATGLLGVVKRVLGITEAVGFRIFGDKFPFMTSHTFVCRVGG